MKQSKLIKYIGLLLVVGLLFAALPTGQAQAQTASVWDGTYPAAKPADTPAAAGGVQEVTTAAQFAWLASQTTMFEPGVSTVKLMVDIDLANFPWTPSQALKGAGNILDGNNHTIQNLRVTVANTTINASYYAAMFVGNNNAVLIKNLTIDGAVIGATDTVINNRVYSAVLFSHNDWYGDLDNVTVKNSSVYGTKYVAALVDYGSDTNIKNCTVQNVTITVNEKLRSGSTSRDEPHIGALIGLNNDGDVSGNTVSGLTINITPIYEPIFLGQTGGLIGTAQAPVLVGLNTASGVTLNGQPYTKLIGLDARTYKVVNATQMLGYTTIQAAIEAANANDVILVANGTYVESPNIYKSLSLIGESEAGVVIDATAIAGYSMEVFGDITTTLQNFTLKGNPTTAGSYGLKVAGDLGFTTIDHVTVTDSYGSGIDLNGLNGTAVSNVTIRNTRHGVGLALTDCSNVAVSNVTTSGNAWGGMAVYTGNTTTYTHGSDSVSLSGTTNSFGESNKLYIETKPGYPVTNFTQNVFPYSVKNGEYVWFVADLTEAAALALGLPAPFDVKNSSIEKIADGSQWVEPGMSIQASVDAAAAGDTINVAAGTYEGFSVVDKTNLTITGEGDTATIIAPTTLINTGVGHKYTPSMLASVFVNNSTGITIEGMAIQSTAATPGSGGADAIVFWNNSTGFIKESIVQGLYTINGAQTGQGIAVDGGTSVLSLINTDISGFQKNGIDVVDGNGGTTPGNLTVNVSGGTITGAGSTSAIAQNGIVYFNQAGGALGGSVTGATINGFDYMPETNSATGLLAYGLGGGTLTVSGNTFGTGDVSVSDNTGTLDLYAILADNSFPAGSAVVGSEIMIPPTKLNMSPATNVPTTDTCGATTVDVMVNAVENMVGYHLEVLFDTSKVTVNSVTNGGFLDATGAFFEPTNNLGNTTGRIIWGMTQQGSGGNWNPKDGSGSLIRITFTPKVAGVIDFTIDATKSMLVSDPDAFLIPFELTGDAKFTFGSVVTNTTKVPNVSYCNLATAVAAATSDDTLRADVDFTTTSQVTITGKTITFNTNNKTITRIGATSDYDSMFWVRSGHLIVTGGGTLNTTSTAGTFGAAIKVIGAATSGAKATLQDATLSGDYASVYVAGAKSSMGVFFPAFFDMTGGLVTDGFVVIYKADLNITGGTVEGWAPIMGNGVAGNGETTITIGGTAVIDGNPRNCVAIFHPQDGVLTVNGGTITGYNGIEMKAGDLIVNGGTIIATGAKVDSPYTNTSGSTNTGDAILVYNHAGYTGDLTVDISGGIINATSGYALRQYLPVTDPVTPLRTTSLAVDGGKFTGGAGSVNFTTVDPLVLKLTGGAYNTDPGDKTLVLPDYVYEPLDTYLNTDNYYYIETIIKGTIAAYDLPNGTETVTGDVVDFLGDIPWYPYQAVPERIQGNRVGVYVTAPAAIDRNVATIHVVSVDADKTWTWNEAEDLPAGSNIFSLWKLISQVPQATTITIKWNNVSTQVFTVNVMTDSVLLLPPAATIDSTDIQGYYLTGEQRQFSVVLTNPTDGANYAHVYVDFTIANAQVGQISSIEYSVDDGANWVALGTGPGTSLANVGSDVVGYFGKVAGGGFPLAAGSTLPTLFRVTFVEREQGAVDFPTSYNVSMKLMDADALFTTLPLDEFAATMQVFDKATVTYTSDPYFIVGEAGNFAVRIVNPTTGKNYANTVVFDVVLQDHLKSDISAISCSYGATTWDLLDALTESNGDVIARIGGLEDGFFTVMVPFDWTINCSVTYTTAGTYTTSTNMVDVVSPLPERVVSANIPGTATVYTKPTVSAAFPTGPYAAGVPVTVPVTITNPGSIPGPFLLVLDLPAGTTIVYGGVTYTCTDTGCPPIPVTLPMTASNLVITFPGSFTGTVGMSLYDTTWTPDRLLAELTPKPTVVVNSGFTVTGTFSMQGRTTRAGIPVTLNWIGLPFYGPSASTSNASSNNFSLAVTYGGDYTVTTLQPRYLNVTSDLGKTINDLTGNYTMLVALRLRGGNAYWNVDNSEYNNVVNIGDATLVGGQFVSGPVSDEFGNNGDCNDDGVVNIQDLTLVGGNFGLTSAMAYSDTVWMP